MTGGRRLTTVATFALLLFLYGVAAAPCAGVFEAWSSAPSLALSPATATTTPTNVRPAPSQSEPFLPAWATGDPRTVEESDSSYASAVGFAVPESSLDTSVLRRANIYRRYIREVEGASGFKISGTQRKQLVDYLRRNSDQLRLLDSAQANRWGKSTRRNLIADWTKNTKQRWPTYSADVISPRTGRPFIRAGHNFDAHEIIPNQLNAPHEWWNVVPVRRPDMHQALIHARDSAYRDLIGLFE